jgi:hypothetical protein
MSETDSCFYILVERSVIVRKDSDVLMDSDEYIERKAPNVRIVIPTSWRERGLM